VTKIKEGEVDDACSVHGKDGVHDVCYFIDILNCCTIITCKIKLYPSSFVFISQFVIALFKTF